LVDRPRAMGVKVKHQPLNLSTPNTNCDMIGGRLDTDSLKVKHQPLQGYLAHKKLPPTPRTTADS